MPANAKRGVTEEIHSAVLGKNPQAQFAGLYPETSFDRESLINRYPDKKIANDEALPTGDNLNHLGFEAIEVKSNDPALPESLSVIFKVSRPSDLVFLNNHGRHDGTVRLTADREKTSSKRVQNQFPPLPPRADEFFTPANVDLDAFSRVKLLALTTCDALDINDYNVNYEGYSLQQADREMFGGFKWSQVASTNGATVVGYNSPGPFFREEDRAYIPPEVIKQFGLDLTTLPYHLAWMSANLKVARNKVNDADIRLLALNASAIDGSGNYYYIPYAQGLPVYTGARKLVIRYHLPGMNQKTGSGTDVYSVPSSVWAKAPFSIWSKNRDKFGQLVSIPGL